jgi:hypothetical protein
MPPRQPLKLNKAPKAKPKAMGPAIADMAAQLLAEEMKPAANIKKAPRPLSFTPYPDLTIAISMLAKRQQAVVHTAERAQLVSRWLKSLQEMQSEMQKLHKLELLAERLARK